MYSALDQNLTQNGKPRAEVRVEAGGTIAVRAGDVLNVGLAG
jgi:hypothetical protein